jgi:Mg2+ and Co2+ transporter CorA
VENRRHKALENILSNSQTNMDSYCARCRELLRIVDQSLTTDYDTQARALEQHFSGIAREKRPSDPEARKDVEQLLQLNSSYMSLMETLAAARDVYETLPRGHKNLLEAVQKKPTDLAAIKDLSEEGQQLKRIYDNLKK